MGRLVGDFVSNLRFSFLLICSPQHFGHHMICVSLASRNTLIYFCFYIYIHCLLLMMQCSQQHSGLYCFLKGLKVLRKLVFSTSTLSLYLIFSISLQLSNYSSFEGVLYCKPHFDQLFKMTGSLDKSFEGDWLLLVVFRHIHLCLTSLFICSFSFPLLQVLQKLLELTDLPIRYLKPHFASFSFVVIEIPADLNEMFPIGSGIVQVLTNSKLSSMFGGTKEKCVACNKTVYPIEKVNLSNSTPNYELCIRAILFLNVIICVYSSTKFYSPQFKSLHALI